MKKNLMNTSKNVLLVLLTLLMALLTVLIWVRSLTWDDIPVESGLGQFYLRMAYGSASVFGLRTEDVPAAYPTEISVCIDGVMLGAQNDASGVDALYEQFEEQIRAALNDSVSELAPGDAADHLSALQKDSIYFKYEHALPLKLIFLWLSDNIPDIPDIAVKSVLISSDGSVWIRNDKNELFVYKTDINAGKWSDQLGDSIFQSCRFAIEESKQTSLVPETLLFNDRKQSFSVIEMAEPNYLDSNGVDNLQVVLEAFEYNTSVGNYMDNTTRVFVNNNSTLRIGSDGQILFHATSLEGGIEAYQQNEVTEKDELPLRVNTAKAMLEQIQRSYTSEADFFLHSVHQDPASERVQLQFQYLCGGIPVVGEEGAFAVVEFIGNTLVSAEIHARTYASVEQLRYLIPAEQFAAMAAPGDSNMLIGYFPEENYLYPHRYFESAV